MDFDNISSKFIGKIINLLIVLYINYFTFHKNMNLIIIKCL